MEIPDPDDRFSWFLRLATFALIVTGLRVADEVLIPVAFAVLLAFLLSPLTVRLTRLGLPKGPAIILTVSVAFAEEPRRRPEARRPPENAPREGSRRIEAYGRQVHRPTASHESGGRGPLSVTMQEN